MPFVPLPFVVALLLFILLWVVARRGDEAAPSLPFLALILLAALQSVFVGLRWGYGISELGWTCNALLPCASTRTGQTLLIWFRRRGEPRRRGPCRSIRTCPWTTS